MNNTNHKHYHSTIIVSACILAGALIAGVIFTHPPQRDSKPPERVVRQQFTEQLRTGLQGKPVLEGVARTVRRVDITDMRYHTKQDLILVEFSLVTEPPAIITGSIILSDDGFRRYTGEWGKDNCHVKFLIK